MAEIPGQADELEPRVTLRGCEHQLVGAVGAAVIDEDRLGVRIQGAHDLDQPRDQLLDHGLLVIGRDHQRVRRHWFRSDPFYAPR